MTRKNSRFMELIWIIISVVVPFIAGTGVTFALSDSTNGEFLFARGCLVFSGLVLMGWTLFWLIQTEAGILHRVIVGAVMGGLLLSGIPESLRWVSFREKRAYTTKLESQLGISSDNLDYKKLLLDAAKSSNPSETILKTLAETPIPSQSFNGQRLDMQAARTALDSRRIQATAQNITAFRPYADKMNYIIATLTSYLADLAKNNEDVLTSDYKGIDNTAFVDQPPAVSIAMKSNQAWAFTVNLHIDSSQASFVIRGNDPGFIEIQMWPTNNSFSARFCQNGRNVYQKQCKLDDCMPVINEALGILIAANNERFPLVKVSPSR